MYFILYSPYKSIDNLCEGASKHSPDRSWTAPPVLKFLDPPLNHIFSVVDTLDLWMKCIKQRIIYMYILVQ